MIESIAREDIEVLENRHYELARELDSIRFKSDDIGINEFDFFRYTRPRKLGATDPKTK